MTKPREKTREELTAEIEDSKKKIRQLPRDGGGATRGCQACEDNSGCPAR